MTRSPDDPNDPAERGEPGGEQGSGRKLDEDAAWREIIAHYADPSTIEFPEAERMPDPDSPAEPVETAEPDPRVDAPDTSEPSADERLRGLFHPTWDDEEPQRLPDDEEHFVPPPPPPIPRAEPRRRLAWIGLFGSPLLMLLTVIFGWSLPGWVMFWLAVGFAGGFVYLVATMPNRRPDDDSGDDGAVL